MRHLLILLLLVFSSCFSKKMIHYKAVTLARYKPEKPIERVLMLNTCDVVSKGFRKPKEELFIRILDSMLVTTATGIQWRGNGTTVVLPGLTSLAADNILALMSRHNATHAIVLNSMNVSFDQTHVEVTKTSTGKDREAYYDIIAESEYSMYDQKGLFKKIPVKVWRQHSSRSVISGLLAVGPDIVNHSKDAFSISITNVNKYLDNFFPSDAIRSRPIFATKDFAAVGAAVKKDDYEAALVESLRLISDPDKTKAAKANYNCAVFMERKNQPAEAKSYLKTSLELSRFSEAVLMMRDFE